MRSEGLIRNGGSCRVLVAALFIPVLAGSGTAASPAEALIRTFVREAAGPEKFVDIQGERGIIASVLKKLDARERNIVHEGVIRIEPDFALDPASLKAIGDAFYHLGDYERCAAVAGHYQALERNDPFGFRLQALALKKLGRPGEEKALRKKAVIAGKGKNPVDVAAYKLAGRGRRRPRTAPADLPARSRKPGFRFHRSIKLSEGEGIEDALRTIVKSAHGRKIVVSVIGSADDPPTPEKLRSRGVEFEKDFRQGAEATRINRGKNGKFVRIVLGPEFFKLGEEESAAFLAGELANTELVKGLPKRSNTLEMFNRIANRVKVAIELRIKGVSDAFSTAASKELALEIRISKGDYADDPHLSPEKKNYLRQLRNSKSEMARSETWWIGILGYSSFAAKSLNKGKSDEIRSDPQKERLLRALVARIGG